MKITTESGFTAELDTAFFDDWEYVEAINAVVEGKVGAMARLADVVLGENKEALKDHVRDENGRVPADKMFKEIFEIIRLAGKNS